MFVRTTMMNGEVREDSMMDGKVWKDYKMVGEVREDYMMEGQVWKN